MIRLILLDIEGTTTDIDFVHQTLFPYSAARLPEFIRTHADTPAVRDAMQAVRETVRNEQGRELNDEGVIETLLQWIASDRKHTALKTLQGLIWRNGYELGDYRGHVYDDVPEMLTRWREAGLKLAIYSSGSVEAQKMLFAHSTHGDLTPFFSQYFDTRIGAKKETDSYRKIVMELNFPPEAILFLSDMPAELSAAAEAGMQVTQLMRKPDSQPVGAFPVVTDFRKIRLPLLVAD